MKNGYKTHVAVEHSSMYSKYLSRKVAVDYYVPQKIHAQEFSLLLINDGQDMPKMHFDEILGSLYQQHLIQPLICVAIAANENRRMEYGVAATTDYLGRGALAEKYTEFIIKEVLPFVKTKFESLHFSSISIAGFSLGGLSALDIVWSHPKLFSKVGVFSGSLWWRSIDQDDPEYDDDKHRIMQQKIRNGRYVNGLSFFFQCGKLDETNDRNNNGIIDAVEDTLDTIHELLKKGYHPHEIAYLEYEDGRHDVPTWGRAMPEFLKWGWGNKK